MKKPNSGRDLFQLWIINCADINNNSKTDKFSNFTKTPYPTQDSGATSMTPNSNSFMYIVTSSGNHGVNNLFVSFEGGEITNFITITFYYIRYSSPFFNLRSMGRFRIQLLLDDEIW